MACHEQRAKIRCTDSQTPVDALLIAAGAEHERCRHRHEGNQRDGNRAPSKDADGDVVDAVTWPRAAWSQAMVSNA